MMGLWRLVWLVAWPIWALAEGPASSPECPSEGTAGNIAEAMRSGAWDCALRLAKTDEATGTTVENEVNMVARSIEQKLSDIKKAIKAPSTQGNILTPAYQWAQSGDKLFVNVKFAHKIDAPATLVDEAFISAVFGDRSVQVNASKGAKRFALSLDFYRGIVAENCTWSKGSVGRATLTLAKAATHREWWPRLLSSTAKKPANQHVWWDKQENFDQEQKEVQREEYKRISDEAAALKAAAASPEDKTDDATTTLGAPIGADAGLTEDQSRPAGEL